MRAMMRQGSFRNANDLVKRTRILPDDLSAL
jgi:hypothetical protein